jgi:hypothetical protein
MTEHRGSENLKPVEPGNTRALTHGVTATLHLAPRTEAIAADLTARVPAYSESDQPTVWLLAGVLAQIESGRDYLAEHGMLDGKGKPRPVMNVLTTLQNSAARLCDQLGLSPTSRARLGVDLAKGADLAAELAKAQAAGDRARQRIADSEVPR